MLVPAMFIAIASESKSYSSTGARCPVNCNLFHYERKYIVYSFGVCTMYTRPLVVVDADRKRKKKKRSQVHLFGQRVVFTSRNNDFTTSNLTFKSTWTLNTHLLHTAYGIPMHICWPMPSRHTFLIRIVTQPKTEWTRLTNDRAKSKIRNDSTQLFVRLRFTSLSGRWWTQKEIANLPALENGCSQVQSETKNK